MKKYWKLIKVILLATTVFFTVLCNATDNANTDSAIKSKKFNSVYAEAMKGNADAQNNLALLYDNGIGVEKNKKEAIAWFTKAAEQGNANAQSNLGVSYYNGDGVDRDYANGVYWYRKAAEQGDAYGQLNLAVAYHFGNGIEKNLENAFELYKKSAQQGNAIAQFNLGNCYANGEGIERDYAEAVAWYEKAARQNHSAAQANLGAAYLDGNGVKKDLKIAFDFYKKAAEAGNTIAQTKLGYMYGTGLGVDIDYIQASKWYSKAAAKGDEVAANNLKIIQRDVKKQQADEYAILLKENDDKRGYKRIDFADFELDAGRKLKFGTKIVVTGAYKVNGQMEMLTENAFTMQNRNASNIVMITKDATREARKQLIQMRSGACGMGGYCKITVLGRISQCDITWIGRAYRETACLILDEIRAND